MSDHQIVKLKYHVSFQDLIFPQRRFCWSLINYKFLKCHNLKDGEILPSQDSVMFPSPRNHVGALEEEATDPIPTIQSSKKVRYKYRIFGI